MKRGFKAEVQPPLSWHGEREGAHSLTGCWGRNPQISVAKLYWDLCFPNKLAHVPVFNTSQMGGGGCWVDPLTANQQHRRVSSVIVSAAQTKLSS